MAEFVDEFLTKTVSYQEKDVEVIKVIFALAFNLNLESCLKAPCERARKKGYSSSREIPYFRLIIGFKTYYLMIDEQLNIAGSDTNDLASYEPNSDFKPVNNQIKISYFLTKNNLVPDIIQDTISII